VARLPLPAPANVPLGPAAGVLAVLWLVGVMNFFNFMDGIDGLAPGQGALVCAEVLVAGWSADAGLLAAVTLAAILGFLPYNLWPSRVFLGDVGSLMVGFLLAAFPLLAPAARRGDAVLATAIGLALFLLDPIETLIRRWRKGVPIGESHRDHRYQQLARRGSPHGPVSAALLCGGVLLCSIGAMVYRWPYLGWLAVGCAIATFLLERRMAVRASARQKPEHALPIELG
jgi:UDP-N-acetylmuramyl pentapeptide phosphotransferase/UDP-N-acetylglucosamine-1-phosphate transferase